MKKFFILIVIFLSTISKISADEIKRISVGNVDAKITIICISNHIIWVFKYTN